MRKAIVDKGKFWQLSPAANDIFKYLDENAETSLVPWGFDSGDISEDLMSSSASFSFTSLAGWGQDKLRIQATLQADGSWALRHTITRAA